jgi:hypothetical protein
MDMEYISRRQHAISKVTGLSKTRPKSCLDPSQALDNNSKKKIQIKNKQQMS